MLPAASVRLRAGPGRKTLESRTWTGAVLVRSRRSERTGRYSERCGWGPGQSSEGGILAIAFRRTVSGPGGCPRHPRRLVVLLLAGGVSLVVSTGIASAATIVIPAGATQISADWSGYGGCAVVDAGAVECWGDNEEGQLGNGSTSPSATPVRVAGLSGAQMVSVGGHHACALLAGGTLRCWGRDMDGELGTASWRPRAPARSRCPGSRTQRR